MIFKYIIEEEITVKDYLVKINIPSNVISSLKNSNGQLIVNDQTVLNNYLMKPSDILQIVFPSSKQGDNIISKKGDFEIIYEDSYLLIINKQPNLATIPTRRYYEDSLANYVMSYYKRTGIEANIHFVGRLDYPTSGIICLAKNSYMLTLMKNAIKTKKYILEVEGIIDIDEGIIETGIKKAENSIIKREVTNDINSKTIYKVLERKQNSTLVSATLCTGKTHQLRLHFSDMGYPIIGDDLYGKKSSDGILHLHSTELTFVHPITNEEMTFTTLPKWFNS